MKRSRCTEEQVAYTLRQAEAGPPAGDTGVQLGARVRYPPRGKPAIRCSG